MKNWTELLLTGPTKERRQIWQATDKEIMHCEQLDITAETTATLQNFQTGGSQPTRTLLYVQEAVICFTAQ